MNERKSWFEIGWKPLEPGGLDVGGPPSQHRPPDSSGSPRMGSSDRSLSGEPDDKEPLDSAGPVTGQDGSGSGHGEGATTSPVLPDRAGLHSVRADLIPIRPRRGLTLLRRDNARYHRQHLIRLAAQAESLADSTRALLDDLHADDFPGPCRGVAVALLRLRQAHEALDHATGKVNANEGDPSGN